MRESVIEKAVCTYATSKSMLSFKFVSPSNRGVPDRLYIHNGEVFFIEFKAPNKKLTPLQNSVIGNMVHHGVNVYVCDSVESGKLIIDRKLKEN